MHQEEVPFSPGTPTIKIFYMPSVNHIETLGPRTSFIGATTVFEIDQTTIGKLKERRQWLQACRKLAADAKSILSKRRYQQFWRTMTYGLTGDGFPAPKEFATYFKQYFDFVQRAPEFFTDYLADAKTLPPGFQGMDERGVPFENITLIEASIQQWASKRRFCVLEGGRLAFVPSTAMAGDVVAVLFGGEVPYVLRRVSSRGYLVIGECYVDGIMHGEALSDGNSRITDFQLQ